MTFPPLAGADLRELAGLAPPTCTDGDETDSTSRTFAGSTFRAVRGDEPTEVFVIVHNAEDVGIVQRYRLGAYPASESTDARSGPTFSKAAGISYLIGIAEQIGRGTGSRAIERFTEMLFDDDLDGDEIVVTPQEVSRGSCQVLEKAGDEPKRVGPLDSDARRRRHRRGLRSAPVVLRDTVPKAASGQLGQLPLRSIRASSPRPSGGFERDPTRPARTLSMPQRQCQPLSWRANPVRSLGERSHLFRTQRSRLSLIGTFAMQEVSPQGHQSSIPG